MYVRIITNRSTDHDALYNVYHIGIALTPLHSLDCVNTRQRHGVCVCVYNAVSSFFLGRDAEAIYICMGSALQVSRYTLSAGINFNRGAEMGGARSAVKNYITYTHALAAI